VAKTQVAAVFLSLVGTLMPSFLFLRFLFPIATMPYVLQIYTYAFPTRYFNDISATFSGIRNRNTCETSRSSRCMQYCSSPRRA
jgi:hypothetical protein